MGGIGTALGSLLSTFRVLSLNTPYEGLTQIANVLAPVGPIAPNNPDDVKVVQNLLHGLTMTRLIGSFVTVPQVTGKFDATTGFWIFYWQSVWAGRHGTAVDGTVSPAQGGAMYGGHIWFIAKLNAAANKANPTVYKRFISALSTGGAAAREFGISS